MSPEEAPTMHPPEFRPIDLDHVNVVRNGTVEGRSTVDFVLKDEAGQQYVFMLTARLVASIVSMVNEPL